MPTLFDISDDMLALERLLTEQGGDLTDDEIEAAIDDWFDENQNAREEKIDAYAALIREFEARAEARSDEADRLQGRADQDEKSAESMKKRLKHFYEVHDMKSLETPRFRVTLAGHGGKQPVEVLREATVPDHLKRTKFTFYLRPALLENGVVDLLHRLLVAVEVREHSKGVRRPTKINESVDNGLLREALDETEDGALVIGGNPVARYRERGSSIRIS
jgi:hypothetical protein